MNLHQGTKTSHPFFHDGRAPISPIDHPKRIRFSFDQNPSPSLFDKNQSPNLELMIGNTSYYHPKSPSFEEDSGSTSGVLTMDEEIHSVHFQNNVV